MDSSWRRNIWEIGAHTDPIVMLFANAGVEVLCSEMLDYPGYWLTNVKHGGPTVTIAFYTGPGMAYGLFWQWFLIPIPNPPFPYGYRVRRDIH